MVYYSIVLRAGQHVYCLLVFSCSLSRSRFLALSISRFSLLFSRFSLRYTLHSPTINAFLSSLSPFIFLPLSLSLSASTSASPSRLNLPPRSTDPDPSPNPLRLSVTPSPTPTPTLGSPTLPSRLTVIPLPGTVAVSAQLASVGHW